MTPCFHKKAGEKRTVWSRVNLSTVRKQQVRSSSKNVTFARGSDRTFLSNMINWWLSISQPKTIMQMARRQAVRLIAIGLVMSCDL